MPLPDGLDIGDPAPGEIALRDQRGQAVRLADFRGRHVVLYFYPADETPGCIVEGREFRDLYKEFLGHDAVVIGVSVDSVESHRAFAAKHALPFTLLSDRDGAMARAFGVFEDGAAQRSTFVLDHDLRVRRRFDQVNPRGHARVVLNFLGALTESHRMLGG